MTRILYGAVIINILLPIFFAKDQDGLEDAFSTAGILLACAFGAYYFFQRRNLMFATSGGSIQIKAGHMTYEECYRFIEFTENAVNVLRSNGLNPILHP